MTEYTAPLRDVRFALENLVDLESLSKLPGFAHATVPIVATFAHVPATLFVCVRQAPA